MRGLWKVSFPTAGVVAMAFVWSYARPAEAWQGNRECGSGYAVWEDPYMVEVDNVDFPTSGWMHPILDITMDLWEGSHILGTPYDVDHGTHYSAGHVEDGHSIVNYADLTGDYLGYTTCWGWSSDCVVDECDITLDNQTSWTTGSVDGNNSSGPYSVSQVFLHELGHSAGFAHEDEVPDIMNTLYPMGGHIGGKTEVGEASRAGLRELYPGGVAGRDIGFSNWHWHLTGSGEGSALPSPYITDDEDTQAFAGGSVDRIYCLHNLGTTSETVVQRFYLSTNVVIDTGDIPIGTFVTITAPGGEPNCAPKTLTIPSTTNSGSYWIGAIADYQNNILETDESNNIATDQLPFEVL